MLEMVTSTAHPSNNDCMDGLGRLGPHQDSAGDWYGRL
jgi:hypothetical protein